MDTRKLVWPAIYISAVLAANYTAIWFVPLPIFGLVAIGTLAFGATFTARDYAHILGRPKVYTMIAIAALASAALSLFGPVDWRIVTASVLAIILSETADTETFESLKNHSWGLRVVGSNTISIPLDSILFNFIAFFGVFGVSMLGSIIFGEILVKTLTGLLLALWKLRL